MTNLIINSFLDDGTSNDIISHCEDVLILENGKLAKSDNLKARKCKVAFTKLEKFGFLKKRILDEISMVHTIDGFEIDDDIDFQFTKYEMGGYYDWHTDNGNHPDAKRYLSVVILLNDNYDGGDLILNSNQKDIIIPKVLGNLVVFDSNKLHKVTPVISGVRYSLVAWLKLKEIDGYIKKLI